MGDVRVREDSVFDFLYVDQERIGLLTSQFGTDGVLRDLERQAASGSELTKGVDLKLVKGDSKGNESQSLTRKFDPRWLVPLTFLDNVQGRLKRSISDAGLGDLVLVSGRLHIIDTAFLQSMYSKDSLRVIAERNALDRATKASEEFNYEVFDLELEMVTSTEPQIQLHFDTHLAKLWSTLRPEALITPPSELAVKHGATVSGDWYLLCLKDAEPIPTPESYLAHENSLRERFNDMPMLAEAIDFMNHARRLFGRPIGTFGITPLLIFRKLGD